MEQTPGAPGTGSSFAPSPPLDSNGSTPSCLQLGAKSRVGLGLGSEDLILVHYSWCRRALWVLRFFFFTIHEEAGSLTRVGVVLLRGF